MSAELYFGIGLTLGILVIVVGTIAGAILYIKDQTELAEALAYWSLGSICIGIITLYAWPLTAFVGIVFGLGILLRARRVPRV